MVSLLELQQRYVAFKRRCWKVPEQNTTDVYFHVLLLEMHEKRTLTNQELDILIQVTREHILAQKSKQTTKWTAKVSDINKHLLML